MNQRERAYYLAQGKSLEIATAFLEEQTAAEEKQKAMAVVWGATCVVPDNWGGVQGFLYNEGDRGPSEEQAHALRDSKFDCMIDRVKTKLPFKAPEKRRKAGQALAKRLSDMVIPQTSALTRRLAGDFMAYKQGMSISYISVEDFGEGVVVLNVPRPGPEPEGAKEMKHSDYFLLVEAAGESID